MIITPLMITTHLMIIPHHLNPAILHIGPIEIRWYGLMYVIGFMATYYLMRKFSREKTFKLSYEQIESLIFYLFLGLFFGARIFYTIIYNFPYYSIHPLEIFAFWKGGLSFHGGLLGIVISGILFSRKNKIPFWHLGDTFVTCAPIGLGFGRLGNFINGELYGRPTNGKWGMIFSDGGPMPRHPSQLYESFFEGFILFCLMWVFRKKIKINGQLSALFLIFYGIFRFGIEFFREPDAQLGFVFLTFSMGQILCVIMILAGVILWVKKTNF